MARDNLLSLSVDLGFAGLEKAIQTAQQGYVSMADILDVAHMGYLGGKEASDLLSDRIAAGMQGLSQITSAISEGLKGAGASEVRAPIPGIAAGAAEEAGVPQLAAKPGQVLAGMSALGPMGMGTAGAHAQATGVDLTKLIPKI
jgi:hypothetical protein